jgi:hypothetical protein
MGRLLRRVRGAVGIGVIWGAAWSAACFLLLLVTGFRPDAPFPLMFAVFGFVAGVVFSAFLALTEGRRRFDQMTLRRFAGWGATGGVLLGTLFAKAASLGWADALMVVPTFAAACALSASGSLALARRAERHALPDGVESELAHPEEQKLL